MQDTLFSPKLHDAKSAKMQEEICKKSKKKKQRMPGSVCTKFNVLVWTDDKAGYIVPLLPIV